MRPNRKGGICLNKVRALSEVIAGVRDGSCIAFGGNVLYRSPIQIAKELAKAGVKDLRLVKTAVAMEADILCACHCLSKVSAGFVGYETEFGLCGFYRKGVESGEVEAEEHACYSVITALRAASFGVPFLPVRGFDGSDLPKTVGFLPVKDPYTGEELTAIRAIRPDYAFIHVQKADSRGNARIMGPVYEDLIMAGSPKHLIITCEELVPDDYFGEDQKADISEVLVEAVAVVKGCAKPGACEGYYDLDRAEIKRFKKMNAQQVLEDFCGKGELDEDI